MHFSKIAVALVTLTPALAQRGNPDETTPDASCNTGPDTDPEAPGDTRRRALHDFSNMFKRHASLYKERARVDKRSGQVNFDDNCNEPVPSNSGYSGVFETRRDVLEAAYADAVTLAETSQSISPGARAFLHYFGGASPEAQLDHVRRMFTGIAEETNRFTIMFECSGTGGDCPNVQSVANTDATVGEAGDEKTIHICNPFWTSASTRYLLHRDDQEEPSPPFRPATSSGWCAMSGSNSLRNAQFFATAGTSILHELTHLHALASNAGLDGDPDEDNRAGTGDFQTGCELLGARAHLVRYQQNDGSDNDVASPDYNAESYAAVATELYFETLCGFDEVRPLAGPRSSSFATPSSTPVPVPSSTPAVLATATPGST
ncbi:hypothetical protein EJ04DRAFT_512195 [Polyplosphaeria fusca]|uniref:Lysine-specific metallo-endopeptidase domain-containing protein n=1 Tax=Polyplosphaeria fusca TaxID=682080 RepID=A0A9P4QVX1_9PLEO|nr:hypothetical protein EJ04DRAFT_512195 [Polyplosphaeria fusca]